ncbi:M23 family metallopeptidase [Patescibacteria group bacterium]|nr:M23 family metallopeptidase [Patescibacteria group bacterium]
MLRFLFFIGRSLKQAFLFLTKPIVLLISLLFKIIIVPVYSYFRKAIFWLKELYRNKDKIYKIFSRYFSYSILILLVLLTGWQGLEAKNITPEQFGKNSLIYSLTTTGEDFEENEEITEGPIIGNIPTTEHFLDDEVLSENDFIIEPDMPSSWQDSLAILTPDDSALEAPSISDPSLIQTRRSETIEYVVESGDILGTIAEKFELNISSILWANDLSFYSTIRPGQKLKIPPVDGLAYKIKKGDTLESIAKKYQSDLNEIVEFNKLVSVNDIIAGQEIMIPGGIKPSTYVPTTRTIASVFTQPASSPATDGGGKLLWPTNSRRITQYYKWRHSGLDIGNKTGQPIYASESGKVTTAGWNAGGYGYYVIINHGNGLETLYAHASKLYVKKGESVSRGDIIAAIGSTGWSTGPHIHYEVKVNGVRKNPLDYIK